jgi:ABC-type xylose transport system permease subunit
VPLLVIAAVVIQLGVGSDWSFESYKPFNNPIFVNLVLQLGLANFVACVIGYTVGRLIAAVMGYLGRNFRTPLE